MATVDVMAMVNSMSSQQNVDSKERNIKKMFPKAKGLVKD
jgi:hypothetical protein